MYTNKQELNIMSTTKTFQHTVEENSKDTLYQYADNYGMAKQVILEIISFLSTDSFNELIESEGYNMSGEEFLDELHFSRNWDESLSLFVKWLSSNDAEDIMDVFEWEY